MTILAVTGSLHSDSYAMKLVKAIKFRAPDSIEFKILDISNLPYVAEDFGCAVRANLEKFYTEIEAADAFIITTAEYKRSYSPALINTLKLGLEADGKSKWAGKLVTVFGCTPYSINAFGEIGLLKMALEALNMEVYYKPDFYFCDIAEKFSTVGHLTDQASSEVIIGFWDIFIKCIERSRIEEKLNKKLT